MYTKVAVLLSTILFQTPLFADDDCINVLSGVDQLKPNIWQVKLAEEVEEAIEKLPIDVKHSFLDLVSRLETTGHTGQKKILGYSKRGEPGFTYVIPLTPTYGVVFVIEKGQKRSLEIIHIGVFSADESTLTQMKRLFGWQIRWG